MFLNNTKKYFSFNNTYSIVTRGHYLAKDVDPNSFYEGTKRLFFFCKRKKKTFLIIICINFCGSHKF